MKKLFIFFVFTLFIVGVGLLGWFIGSPSDKSSFIPNPITPKERELDKYTIDNLSKHNNKPGKITIREKLDDNDNYATYLFNFKFNPNLDGKTHKSTTGQVKMPKSPGKHPVVVMFRGYVDQEYYQTGMGTSNAASFFAKNGFITVAPDFLGYGGSDEEAGNIFETRFQTYITALSLIKTLEEIPTNLNLISSTSQLTNQLINQSSIFLWGHSNRAQIALTLLEITRANYPTTLWAPVSKPFPYSVLYYTDEAEDRGKLIRSELAKFEDLYDTDLYSITDYIDRINAPIQLHQGTLDNSVPISWSNDLVNVLKKLDKDVQYHTYPGTDHNMRPNWDTVVNRDLEFFKSHTK
jgi:fermentation-respiration switch protein FrsA (DUF1100 family)